LQQNDEHLAANRNGRDKSRGGGEEVVELTWGIGDRGRGRGEVTSEARVDEGIRAVGGE
jgi:hypothetical protein